MSLDDVGKKVAEAACANAVDCHAAETEADCMAANNVQMDEFKAYVENGTLIYHPEKFDACLAALKNTYSCSLSTLLGGVSNVAAACDPVFEGTVADGGACFDDEQCVSNECEVNDPNCSDQCCPGKCVAGVVSTPAKIGESCADADCESGAYCQSDASGNPTTCAAKIAMGQPCESYDSCAAPTLCSIDLQTGKGTCSVPAAEGATCNPNTIFPCDRTDNVCDSATMKCVLKGIDGATCMSSSQCVEYTYCDASGKCAKAPKKGEACDVNNDECLADLDCINGTCGFEPETVCK